MNSNAHQSRPRLLPPWFRGIDLTLLILLLLVTNQAVITLKLAGLALVFISRPNMRLGLLKGRLPLFYLAAILLGVLNLLIHVRDFSRAYLTALGLASGYWLVALYCSHQLRLSVDRGAGTVHRTLKLFAFVNTLVSIGQLVRISLITHKLNPYVGLDFPYGMSTGDNIYGAFMQLSYCNMMVSAMLCIYFLFRRDLWASLAACTSLLLVFGNVGNVIFAAVIAVLFVLFLLRRWLPAFLARLTPPAGSGPVFLGFALLFAVFYGVVSADNLSYTSRKVMEKVEQASMSETTAEHQNHQQQQPQEAEDMDRFKQLRFAQYERRPYVADTADYQRRVELTRHALSELQGKRLSLRETKAYLRLNAGTMLLGAGPVRFSSLTALRMSGLDSSRLFRSVLPRFVAPVFHDNHRLLSVERITAPSAQFSNANWPDSFYNQLFGEYGLLGALAFLLLYVWYFLRRWKSLSYGVWIAAVMLPFALLTYIFEPLCVVLFFELLLFLDIFSHDSAVPDARSA